MVAGLMSILTSDYDGFFCSSASPAFVIFYFAYFLITILAMVRWYPVVVLLCIALIANNIDDFQILLTICISFWGKCLLKSFAHALIGLAIFLLHFLSCLHIPGYQSFARWMAVKYFSHFVGCLLVLLIVSFVVRSSLVIYDPSCLVLLLFPVNSNFRIK